MKKHTTPFLIGLLGLFWLTTPTVGAQSVDLAEERAGVQSGRNAEQETQFHRARTAWESGISMLEAKARIDRVLKELPRDVEALKLRTSILMGLGRPADAIDDALYTVQLTPTDGEAQLLLCETAVANGNKPIATAALEAASVLILSQSQHLIRLSACALAADDSARAEALARIVVAQKESDPRGHIQLARVFLRGGRLDAARNVLDKLVENGLVTHASIAKDPEFLSLYSKDS